MKIFNKTHPYFECRAYLLQYISCLPICTRLTPPLKYKHLNAIKNLKNNII